MHKSSTTTGRTASPTRFYVMAGEGADGVIDCRPITDYTDDQDTAEAWAAKLALAYPNACVAALRRNPYQ